MHDIVLMLVRLGSFLKPVILHFKYDHLVQKYRFIGKTNLKFREFLSLEHVNAL